MHYACAVRGKMWKLFEHNHTPFSSRESKSSTAGQRFTVASLQLKISDLAWLSSKIHKDLPRSGRRFPSSGGHGTWNRWPLMTMLSVDWIGLRMFKEHWNRKQLDSCWGRTQWFPVLMFLKKNNPLNLSCVSQPFSSGWSAVTGKNSSARLGPKQRPFGCFVGTCGVSHKHTSQIFTHR